MWLRRLIPCTILSSEQYKAPSIKVSEVAKAIQNGQRDLKIYFVNELVLIFDRMKIDTHDVLEAAAIKWNFLPFKPSLVVGNCISVAPYFLTHKSTQLGYTPWVVFGRNVNDSIPRFVADKVIDLTKQKGIFKKKAKALIL